jgi:exodeoxyribonuclease-3
MKIISWNVNGIRAVLKKRFVEWVKIENPDILCLQEVKAFETQIPTEIRFGFQDYNYVWHRSERP